MKTTKGQELDLNQQEIDLIFEIKHYAPKEKLLANMSFIQTCVHSYEFPCCCVDCHLEKSESLTTIELISTAIRKIG